MPNWRTLCPTNDPKHLVRGTELESCIPDGFLSRFRIVSVRTVGWERDDTSLSGGYTVHDVKYRVYDAASVTDAEVREGIKPRSVGDFPTLEAALSFIEPCRYIPMDDDD